MPYQPRSGRLMARTLREGALLALIVATSASSSVAQPERRPQLRVARPVVDATPRHSTLDTVFQLSSVFGDRDVFEITLGGPGTVKATVRWRGSADRLALILNGPGQTGYYARQDGTSPLSISFDVTRELFQRGATWTISVVNFDRRGSAVGRVVVDYPPATPALATLSPQLRRLRDTIVARPPRVAAPGTSGGAGDPSSPDPLPAAAPERSIVADGRVQVRYPDGRTVIYEAGCGSTTIFPDGSVMGTQCAHVQAATPPALPPDPALQTFLETHRDHLLQHISTLVDHRQPEIDLYLDYESKQATGLLEQIRMRTRLMDNLLQ